MELNLNQKIIDAFTKLYNDKNRNYKKLLFLADNALRKFFGNRNISTNGQELIDKIIEDLLTGKRSWDIDKYPEAYDQILYIFEHSERLNLINKHKRLEKAGFKLEINTYDEVYYDNEPDDPLTKDNLLEKDNLQDLNFLKEQCDEAMKKCEDEDCVILYLEILKLTENKNTNKQLAKNLGIKINEVVAIKKRLRNYLDNSIPTKN
jgi:hypothetical protein